MFYENLVTLKLNPFVFRLLFSYNYHISNSKFKLNYEFRNLFEILKINFS